MKPFSFGVFDERSLDAQNASSNIQVEIHLIGRKTVRIAATTLRPAPLRHAHPDKSNIGNALWLITILDEEPRHG